MFNDINISRICCWHRFSASIHPCIMCCWAHKLLAARLLHSRVRANIMQSHQYQYTNTPIHQQYSGTKRNAERTFLAKMLFSQRITWNIYILCHCGKSHTTLGRHRIHTYRVKTPKERRLRSDNQGVTLFSLFPLGQFAICAWSARAHSFLLLNFLLLCVAIASTVFFLLVFSPLPFPLLVLAGGACRSPPPKSLRILPRQKVWNGKIRRLIDKLNTFYPKIEWGECEEQPTTTTKMSLKRL